MSASTQGQALAAILFLYRDVLDEELPWLTDLIRAPRRERAPVVLTRDEVRRLLGQMSGTTQLVARLLYGTGMRLLEGLRLRVKDLDFEAGEIVVRSGKGGKDRTTTFPRVLAQALRGQMEDRQRAGASTLEAESSGGITSVSTSFSEPCRKPCGVQVFPSLRPRIPCVIPSPPTCWPRVTTSAHFRVKHGGAE